MSFTNLLSFEINVIKSYNVYLCFSIHVESYVKMFKAGECIRIYKGQKNGNLTPWPRSACTVLIQSPDDYKAPIIHMARNQHHFSTEKGVRKIYHSDQSLPSTQYVTNIFFMQIGTNNQRWKNITSNTAYSKLHHNDRKFYRLKDNNWTLP